jgi:hypothetical protein
MKELRLKNGIIGVAAVLLGFIAKAVYRPYVYAHELTDYGIADSAPSFFYVIGFSQLLLVSKHTRGWVIILLVTSGSILFEVMQSGHGHLDLSDIVASILGGAASWFLLKASKCHLT